MSTDKLLALEGLSPAAHAYRESILELLVTLERFQAANTGPAKELHIEKYRLLSLNEHLLQDFVAILDKYTVAGYAVSPEERKQMMLPAQEALHPLVMQSPFARRSYEKPMGYPGDYGMVNQILGDPFDGDSEFAQLLNYGLLQTDVAQGHRNRISVLQSVLSSYAESAAAHGRQFRVLSIGCGPAEETFRFLRSDRNAHAADFSLLDFSRETLDWTKARLDALQVALPDTAGLARVRYIEDSVYNLAKRKPELVQAEYDLVICAGLFDYLTDRLCRRVMEVGAKSLLPGGTLLVTNVSQCRDSFFMSNVMEWDLIYRTGDELRALLPQGEQFTHNVYAESTGTNVVAETRLSDVQPVALPVEGVTTRRSSSSVKNRSNAPKALDQNDLTT